MTPGSLDRFARLGLEAAEAVIRGDTDVAMRHLQARDEILRLDRARIDRVSGASEDPGQAVLLCAIAQTAANLAALRCARRTFTDLEP